MSLKQFLVLLFVVFLLDSMTLADNCKQVSTSLSQYVNCKVSAMAALEVQQTDLSKQSEANAAAPSSTTLGDHSSGPDFVAASLTFPALASKSSVPNSTDYSVSVSMYAFYSFFRAANPFDPHLYDNTSTWRKVSFNFVDSYPSEKTSSISTGSRTYGTTFLLHGSRDVGDPDNQQKLATLRTQVGLASGDFAKLFHEILSYLITYSSDKDLGKFADEMENPYFFGAIIGRMSSAGERHVEQIICNTLTAQIALMKAINGVVKEIAHTPQLSALFTSRISRGTSPNLYRFGLAYDSGVVGQLNSTTDMSYDFMNAQQPVSRNRQVFRLVQQFQYVALSTSGLPKRNILALAGSGEGDWGSNGAPVYKANAKVTVSAMAGVDFPLSFTYTSLIPGTGKSDVKFQAAFAFDFSKISRALAH
jgi:hypothetical protein